jgi:gamma-glutamylcyclotransferase (GGCT)/AIG2-like uncharacterized protein YtfP
MPAHLFVYGTLMCCFQSAPARRLRRDTCFTGAATVNGILFDLGAYPGIHLLPNSRRLVYGEVYRVDRKLRLLHFLDQYEGCAPGDPLPHLYRREVTMARLASGRRLPVWVYALTGTGALKRPIPSGRFAAAARRPSA